MMTLDSVMTMLGKQLAVTVRDDETDVVKPET